MRVAAPVFGNDVSPQFGTAVRLVIAGNVIDGTSAVRPGVP